MEIYESYEVIGMKHNLHICRGFLLLSLMAIIILLLGPAAGMAAEAGPLTIDSGHRYEGMERSYAEATCRPFRAGRRWWSFLSSRRA